MKMFYTRVLKGFTIFPFGSLTVVRQHKARFTGREMLYKKEGGMSTDAGRPWDVTSPRD